MNQNLTNPWRIQSSLHDMQSTGEPQTIRLSNGENFRLTSETTQEEMYLAQCRGIYTAVFMMK